MFASLTVMLEVESELRSAYRFQPPDIARALRAFAGLPTVTIDDPQHLAAALDLAESAFDFADVLHVTAATQCTAFVTFDRALAKAAKAAGLALDNCRECRELEPSYV